MVRPLFREPMRTLLTILAIALGVAVVLAIDLAGGAAAGSFRSSMETLAGENDLEVTASGGVPESVVGTLATLPYSIRVSPRMEDYAVIADSKKSLPLIGLDLVAEGSTYAQNESQLSAESQAQSAWEHLFEHVGDADSIGVGSSAGYKTGDRVELLINDQVRNYTVRGLYPDSNGNESAIVMDLAAAQQALARYGRVDRILLKVPESPSLDEALAGGASCRCGGSSARHRHERESPHACGFPLELAPVELHFSRCWRFPYLQHDFRFGCSPPAGDWNRARPRRQPWRHSFGIRRRSRLLRSHGRSHRASRRPLHGDGRGSIDGGHGGIALRQQPARNHRAECRIHSSRAGDRHGSLASAYSPAREASMVSPVEAMARGRREYDVRVHKARDVWLALVLGLAAAAASRAPAVAGKPFLGYLAAILLVAASALAMPAFVDALTSLSSKLLGKLLGVEAMLASRSLAASLRRTSVLVGALSTAIAMMTAVGIMVGSFRQTVMIWMSNQLPADLYLRPAGSAAADRHPTISSGLAEEIAKLPGVAAVDRLRAYEIRFEDMPATLASADLNVLRSYHNSDFFSGRPREQVLAELRDSNAVIVSEPFTYKHHLKAGDSITLSLGETQASFRIADIYYDYSSERGNVLMDRKTMLRYLPDPAPSNLAIYVSPDAQRDMVRAEIEKATAGHRVLLFSNRDLRAEAIRIFDRTFAISYALEAVAVIVAVMGIAGALLALVIDRRRELGLLRFLGAATGQVRKLILVEAGLLGLLANLAGLALGFALSLILIYVVNKQSFGWTIRFHWPVEVLLGALTVVYGATVLAGLYPAQVAVRLNPLEVVHEE